jgi:Glycosyl hydrolases family 39
MMNSPAFRFVSFLTPSFAALTLSGAAANDAVRMVSADLMETSGPLNTMFKRCVGAGRANEGLRADWQRQLAVVRRECGFESIRMHGLFCDDMGVHREVNGTPKRSATASMTLTRRTGIWARPRNSPRIRSPKSNPKTAARPWMSASWRSAPMENPRNS